MFMKIPDCNKPLCFFCRSCQPAWRNLNRINGKKYSFKKGELICKEGELIDGMYFLTSGAAKVHKQWGNAHENIIRFARAGDVLGFRGMSDNTFAISATALEDCNTCFIPNEHVKASFPVNPNLSIQFMQLYANELQLAEMRMNNLANLDVKGRISGALLSLHQKFGEDNKGHLRLRISRQDIASYAGTTYETLFRVFSIWIAKGIIKTEGKSIKICKLGELKKESDA